VRYVALRDFKERISGLNRAHFIGNFSLVVGVPYNKNTTK
jgi:hypothetical protein